MSSDDLPSLAALFLVVFDQKVGYTIAWKRRRGDVDLDGVEFKCLPSGLHDVREDLVYFVHGAQAGISAFLQDAADEAHRNANFVAVGALVPLTYGRLGKSWLHAAELRRLARAVVQDGENNKRPLELYWEQHRHQEETASSAMSSDMPQQAEVQRNRKRARSDASGTLPIYGAIPPDHPALSASHLLDTFGPLIFPLYRAALLRKRILLLGTPPVQQSCNFVYLLSILSSIPQALIDVVQPDSEASVRTQTLFSVGINDIPFLSDQKGTAGWLACTTDDILQEKKDLYDVLINLSSKPSQRPSIRTSQGHPIKATQRDLRRYRLLRAELNRVNSIRLQYRDDPDNNDDHQEATPLMRASTSTLLQEVRHAEPNEIETVEPVSWTAMAYTGFMWWASAGEMEAWETEETRTDRQLLDNLPEMGDLLPRLGADHDGHDGNTVLEEQATATVVTAYFHRLTAQIVQPLAELVEDADDETDEGLADAAIAVSADDVRAMGLDSWSLADTDFVNGMMELYFGREATLEAGGARICGVKIC